MPPPTDDWSARTGFVPRRGRDVVSWLSPCWVPDDTPTATVPVNVELGHHAVRANEPSDDCANRGENPFQTLAERLARATEVQPHETVTLEETTVRQTDPR